MADKISKDSETVMTEIVLPNDTNPSGNLRGGKLVDWMDIAGEIAAQKHSNQIAVTAAIDHVTFNKPIGLGDIVTIKSIVTRSFNTSMEVFVEAWAQNLVNKKKYKTNEAYFTFVAVNAEGWPVTVPALLPDKNKSMFDAALERRNKRIHLNSEYFIL